jgi:hypothetical protein
MLIALLVGIVAIILTRALSRDLQKKSPEVCLLYCGPIFFVTNFLGSRSERNEGLEESPRRCFPSTVLPDAILHADWDWCTAGQLVPLRHCDGDLRVS